jgi:hypothetical protein
VCLLPLHGLFNLIAAFGTKRMTPTEPSAALRAGQFEARFEVLDGNRTRIEIYVFNLKSKGFTDAATQPEKEADKYFISHVNCHLFQLLYVVDFQISFIHIAPSSL